MGAEIVSFRLASERLSLVAALLCAILAFPEWGTAQTFVAETEPNDTKPSANVVAELSTWTGPSAAVKITGASDLSKDRGSVFSISHEENGSISTATPVPLSGVNPLAWTQCTLGDGLHGSSGTGTGDYDFFVIPNVPSGVALVVDVDTPGPLGSFGLDSGVAIFNSAGTLLTVNDDDGHSSDSRAFLVTTANDDYFVVLGGAGMEMPSDPFDPASGPGADTEGTYEMYLHRRPATVQASEDNGSMSTATSVFLAPGVPVVSRGVIGDGPHGSSGSGSGDFDFFRLNPLAAGTTIVIDVNAVVEGSALDSYVALWNASGLLIASNDDEPDTTDSRLVVAIPQDGVYYVSVGGAGGGIPEDPVDSSSGPGAGSEGSYTILLEVPATDPDFFRLNLRRGDVIGASIDDPKSDLQVISNDGRLLVGSNTDHSPLYPASSPLPGVAGPTMACVIPNDGIYYLKIDGHSTDSYECDASVHRPFLESAGASAKQIFFLDFDGATVDTTPFGGPGARSLSPLSSFLAAWGLSALDEDAVITAIINTFRENVENDLRWANNDFFAVEIRNSRDHADPFGNPHVSRIVIGGTQAQAGVSGIAAAESIDPGNFDTTETAIVLLDELSGPASNPSSLNSIPRTTGMIPLVGRALGNIASHAAGHLTGNFDTHGLSTAMVMNAPEFLATTVGAGEDGVFGTGDDVDVDFKVGVFGADAGLSGYQDTRNTTAFGLTTQPSGLFVNFDMPVNGNGSVTSPFKFLSSAVSAAGSGANVRVFSGTTAATFQGTNRISKPMTLRNHTPGFGTVRIGQQ